MPFSYPFPARALWAVLLGLIPAFPARPAPTLFVESAVAAPGSQPSVFITANEEVQGYRFCLELAIQPLTPGAPEQPRSTGACTFPFPPLDGPRIIGPFPLPAVPADTPVGTQYRIAMLPTWGIWRGTESAHVNLTPGILIVRNTPLLRGDLDGNGTLQVGDVILSLRLLTGVDEPSPYARAAADADRDALITLTDTVTLLRQVVGLSEVGDSPAPLPFREVARWLKSGVTTPGHRVIRTLEEWYRVWEEHGVPETPLPPVDFSREQVIVVYMGNHYDEYDLRVKRVDISAQALWVYAAMDVSSLFYPRRHVQPAHFIAVPISPLSVHFSPYLDEGMVEELKLLRN